jgi:hypothetical protein
VPGEKYVIRVVNFAAADPYSGKISFAGPDPAVPAQKEAWRLNCSVDGERQSSQRIVVNRGQRLSLDLRKACKR